VPFSVRLTQEEEALLEAAAKRTSRSKSELAREGIREFCQRLAPPERSPFEHGKSLFGAGVVAKPPRESTKRAVWEKLRAKHSRLG